MNDNILIISGILPSTNFFFNKIALAKVYIERRETDTKPLKQTATVSLLNAQRQMIRVTVTYCDTDHLSLGINIYCGTFQKPY